MKQNAGIGKLFIILFSFFLVLPLGGFLLFFLTSIYDSTKLKISGDVQTAAYSIAGKVNTRLEAPAGYLLSVADVIGKKGLVDNSLALLQYGVKNTHILESVYLLDKEKKIVDLSFSSFNMYEKSDFIGITLSSVKGFKDYEVYWSHPFISFSGSNYLVRISVRYPDGYVVGDINLQFLSEDLLRLHQSDNAGVFIIDDHGDIISATNLGSSAYRENLFRHPVAQKAYQGGHVVEDYTYDGQRRIGAGYKLPATGWFLVFEQSRKSAFGFFDEIVRVTAISFVVAMFFILVVLYFIRQKLIRPLEKLTVWSESISEGIYKDFEAADKNVLRELRVLYDSFENMSERILEREKALKDKEEYIRSVFDSTTNTGLIVISTDSEPVITDANTGAQLILDYKLSEMIGQYAAMMVKGGGDDLGRLQKGALRRGNMTTARFEMVKKTGVSFPVLCSVHPMHNSDGTIEALIAVFIDITEITRIQNALKREKERLDVTLKSIGEGVVAADKTGRITLMNSSAEFILAQKTRFLLGRDVAEVLKIRDFDTGVDLSAELTRINDSFSKTFRANIDTEHSGAVTVNLTSSAMVNNKGEAVGFVYVFRDITERIRMDQELLNRKMQLEEINRNLEIRVTEEAEKRRKNEQLLFEQAKFAAMGQMISAIAHQWRQPLNALALYTQDIEDAYDAGEVDGVYLRGFVVNSMKLIHHMSGTIDDFRNFFHSSNKREPVSIVSVVSESVSLISTQLRNQNIDYEIIVRSDREEEIFKNALPDADAKYGKDILISSSEMKQVLLNILQNARDAIAEKRNNSLRDAGNIYITIEYKEMKVAVSISNDGVKIPDDSFVRIFDPYYTTKPEGEGTGIGLYMSKVMVEDHMGGLLTACNVEDGAKFTVTLYYGS
ncbi:multi-sensor signal transduction histidine kinase [Denitrovibrio acetiphilus DSM 12809]|uniref:histidine kinase n=1 Tax=Denitrovibrio acetiphilus (strain DSM 12809 / NBRC 114555 / N2460) TaxID=522772 RepID=D4H5P5_DENA2|nr:PAS domain S-box protein [Denitrovibrio acetiphilus]ADD69486.1 multi-sensor signal transduction histidine kinase [Denitrovibrio acetiphilus DSM 12809]